MYAKNNKVLIRTFNQYINGKTGEMLHLNQRRGGITEWDRFEKLMVKALQELDLYPVLQMEHPSQKDIDGDFKFKVYCHRNLHDKPDEKGLFYMQMHLKDLFTLDPLGWGYFAKSRQDMMTTLSDIDILNASIFQNYILDKFLNHNETKISAPYKMEFKQSSLKKISFKGTNSLPDDYILAPLQVSRDYVIKNLSPVSVQEFIQKISSWAKSNKKHVVFKPHPFNNGDPVVFTSLLEAQTNPYVTIANGNIHEMIKRASSVWVINSGVGFESLFHSKPIVTFGNCDYESVTIAGQLNDLNQVNAKVAAFNQEQKERQAKFVFDYCLNYHFLLDPNYESQLETRIKKIFTAQL